MERRLICLSLRLYGPVNPSVTLSAINLPHHTFYGQAYSSKLLTNTCAHGRRMTAEVWVNFFYIFFCFPYIRNTIFHLS